MSAAQHTDGGGEVVVPVTRERALAQYPEMVTMIPEAEVSDGSEMVADVLMATSWEQLNDEAKLPSFEDLAPASFRVNAVTRAVSDIEGGLGFYLLVDCQRQDGTTFKAQTSSAIPMAKLTKLFLLGALPAVVTVSKAQKATRGGKFPLNLHVDAVSNQ